MLIKHGAIYLLSRIVPGLGAFASLVIYTRLLSPDEYGIYALAIATIFLLQALVFSWLELSVLRVLPAQAAPERLLSTVLGLFLLLLTASTVLAGLVWACTSDQTLRQLLPLGIPMLWVHAWMEL